MKKIYRYRPLTDFLFKELYYRELYFASYCELNDPLDLSARINFRPINEHQVECLIHYLLKTSIVLLLEGSSDSIREYSQKLMEFLENKELKKKFCERLYNNLIDSDFNKDFLPYDIVEKNVIAISKEFKIEIRLAEIKNELLRLTKVFLENSYATCFSKTHTNFLMWSHYASKHSGICLEFSLEHEGKFPYILIEERKLDKGEYSKRYSEVKLKGYLFWDGIREVEYHKNPPSINFYDFLPVFESEGDCDLMALSKSRWHGFAHGLERVFSIKTLPWKYEKEWRAIGISFGKSKEPEERIRHYPIEVLTGIYFGIRTPEIVKYRIYNMLKPKNIKIKYFDGHLTNHRDLKFREWECNKE